MVKKSTIVLCVGVLIVSMLTTTAQAARSITAKDLVHVVTVQKENLVTKEPDLSIQVVGDTDRTLATLEEVFARTEAQDMLLPDYFGEVAKEELVHLLPEDFDLAKLVLQELVTCSALNYSPEFGNVTVDIEFATSYLPGQMVVAMAGVPYVPETLPADADGGAAATEAPAALLPGIITPVDTADTQPPSIEWHAVQAAATHDGLSVTFSREMLEKLSQQETFMLGVLSEWPYHAPK